MMAGAQLLALPRASLLASQASFARLCSVSASRASLSSLSASRAALASRASLSAAHAPSSLPSSSLRSSLLCFSAPLCSSSTGSSREQGSGASVPLAASVASAAAAVVFLVSPESKRDGHADHTTEKTATVGCQRSHSETHARAAVNEEHDTTGTASTARVVAARASETEGQDEPTATGTPVLDGAALRSGDLGLVLYQYTSCPFCNKVRAALDYYNLPYRMVEVDPLKKKEIEFSKYKKVPILLVERGDGQPPLQLNDSTVIVSAVAAALGVEQDADAAHWRAWVDDHLVHLLPANIYRTPREALASFDYLLDSSFEFGAAQRTVARYVGAIVMFALCRLKLNKKYNITDPRGQLYAAVDAWVTGLAGNDFLGGASSPTLADVTVFGALRSLEGLATFDDMMANTAVGPWYARMQKATGEGKGTFVSASEVAH